MKANKLFWALASVFAVFALASCDGKDNQEPGDTPAGDEEEEEEEVEAQPIGIENPGSGKTTLVVYIPNSACADATPYVIGSLPGDGSWTNVEDLKMTRCEGKKEWWQVTVEALNAENATNFKFRMDDGANGWKFEPKQTYVAFDANYLAIKADEDKNLIAIADCDDQVLFIECGEWATPCKETNKAGKAVITVTAPEVPAGYTVGVVGSFAEAAWDLAAGVRPMTAGEGVYTLEVEVPESFEFKVLISEDGATWSWDLGQSSNDNYAMGLDLKANITIEAWKGL